MIRYKVSPIWHVEAAVVLAIVLQLALADPLSPGPKYAIAGLEMLLLIGLRIGRIPRGEHAGKFRRLATISLTALVSVANIISLILVCSALIHGDHNVQGEQLLISALSIYITNIVMFGLWYWQLDGGGSGGRGIGQPPVDFLFPQMGVSDAITQQPDWQPTFFDYLFISITTATAFSPTEAMPLTHRAKFLLSTQGLVSLATVALVAARAINILA